MSASQHELLGLLARSDLPLTLRAISRATGRAPAEVAHTLHALYRRSWATFDSRQRWTVTERGRRKAAIA